MVLVLALVSAANAQALNVARAKTAIERMEARDLDVPAKDVAVGRCRRVRPHVIDCRVYVLMAVFEGGDKTICTWRDRARLRPGRVVVRMLPGGADCG